MDIRKLFYLVVGASLVIGGCGPSEAKKPTQEEVKAFKGTPLTPEQVAKLRGSMGGGGGPMAAGPTTGGGTTRAATTAAGN